MPRSLPKLPPQLILVSQIKYSISANLTPSIARAAILEIALDLGDMHEEQVLQKGHG